MRDAAPHPLPPRRRKKPIAPSLPSMDLFYHLMLYPGSGHGIGRIVTVGKETRVVVGLCVESYFTLPCDGPGRLTDVLRTAATPTGEVWSPERTARFLIERYEDDADDSLLPYCLAGHALAASTEDGDFIAAWLIAAAPPLPPNLPVGDDLALVVDMIDVDSEECPPLIQWAMAHSEEGPVRRRAAPEGVDDWQGARELAVDFIDLLEEDLVAAWSEAERIAPGSYASRTSDGSDALVIAEADEDASSYLLLDLEDGRYSFSFAADLVLLDSEAETSLAPFATVALLKGPPPTAWILRNHAFEDVPSWTPALTLALGCYYRYRMSGRPGPGEPKAVFRALQQNFKACGTDDRRRITALLPELVNPARRSAAALKTLDVALLEQIASVLAGIFRQVDEETGGRVATMLDEGRRGATPPATPTRKSPPAKAPSPTPPAPTRKAPRVLRAKIDARDLLALEWPLAPGDGAFAAGIASTLDWLGQRLGTELPAHWGEGIHEIELGGVRLQVAANERIFAMRLEHPDSAEVARTWRLEATVVSASDGRGGMVGLRLSTLDREELKPPPRSIPGLLDAWRSSPGLCVVEGVAERLPVNSSMAFFQLRNALGDPARKHAIWVYPAGHAAAFAKVPALVQQCPIDDAQLDEYAGKMRAIAPGTWHAYAPGQSAPFVHPLSAVGRHVAGLIAEATATHGDGPRFRDVLDYMRDAAAQQRAALQRLGAGAEPSQQPAPPTVASAVSDLQVQLDEAIGDAEALRAELEEARRLNKRLRGRVRALEAGVNGDPGAADAEDEAPAPPPETLAGIADWVPELAPRVQFADKALRTAARIDHMEPDLIYAALQALHDHYWEMRWGDDPAAAKDRWDAFLDAHRLRFGHVGAAPNNHRFADAYQARVGGRRVTMDLHVQGNSGRDPKRCLRIYLYADDARKILCVGHLPTHLDSTLT